MSMFNDIDWKNNDENCISNAERGKNYAKKFLPGHWTYLGPGSEEKWYGSSSYAQKGEWDSAANKMIQRFKETGHPVFKSISALSRGILIQKKGENTIHFKGIQQTQDSCSKQFILFVSSVFTEQWRIGVNISAWQRAEIICGQQDVDKCST